MATTQGLCLFANNAQSVLAGPLSPSSVTANLAPGSGQLFPAPAAGQFFALTITDQLTPPTKTEIVYCTARNGDTVTIIRARENTSAQSWATNDPAANFFTEGTAEALIQVKELQVQAPNFGVDLGSVNNLAITLVPNPGSYLSIMGAPIRVAVAHTTTGPTTLNINGLGAIAILNPDNTQVSAGQLRQGAWPTFYYNSVTFVIEGGTRYYPYDNPLGFLTNVPATPPPPTPTPPTPTPTPGVGVVTFNSRNGNVQLSFGDVTGALGYTPLKNNTDTFTGALTVNGQVGVTGPLHTDDLLSAVSGISCNNNIHANGVLSTDQVVQVGTSSTQPAQQGVQGSALGAGYVSCASQSTAGAFFGTSRGGGGDAVGFYYGTTFSGSIHVVTGSCSLNTGSDRRIKTGFKKLDKGRYYTREIPVWDYMLKGGEGFRQLGFVADEVQPYVPGVVVGEKDALEDDGSLKIQTMDYARMVVPLWHDTQLIDRRVLDQDARIADLEKLVAKLSTPWWRRLAAKIDGVTTP